MRYSLRTLLIALTIGPALLAWSWDIRLRVIKSQQAPIADLDVPFPLPKDLPPAFSYWEPAPMPHPFRFTIRDVLWLMVVVGIGGGWWVEHRQQVELRVKQARIQEELVRAHQAEAMRARESEAASRVRAMAEGKP